MIEIISNQSTRKGFASKEINENLMYYTPIILLKRYGFIFKYISKQIYNLIQFRQAIHEMNDDESEENEQKHVYFQKLPKDIQNCFHIFIDCLMKLFKYKPFESNTNNRKVFDNKLLKNLYVVEYDN